MIRRRRSVSWSSGTSNERANALPASCRGRTCGCHRCLLMLSELTASRSRRRGAPPASSGEVPSLPCTLKWVRQTERRAPVARSRPSGTLAGALVYSVDTGSSLGQAGVNGVRVNRTQLMSTIHTRPTAAIQNPLLATPDRAPRQERLRRTGLHHDGGAARTPHDGALTLPGQTAVPSFPTQGPPADPRP